MHITEVHRTGQESNNKVPLISIKQLKRYISLCKNKQPVVPENLTEVLVDSYVDLRRDARSNRDTTYTSARNLLAVIRLSTALARLRLSDTVVGADVIEALRLLEMSKDSLKASPFQKAKNQKPVDQIFSTVRDLAEGDVDDVGVSEAEAWSKCQGKGFTREQFDEFLNVYEDQNVIMIDKKHKRIIFV